MPVLCVAWYRCFCVTITVICFICEMLQYLTPSPNRILNIFLIIISLCTYIMIASSAYRMGLYVGQYGLTTLRFFVFWALGVIALIMIGIIFLISRRNFPLFNYMMIIAGGSFIWRPGIWCGKYRISASICIFTIWNIWRWIRGS